MTARVVLPSFSSLLQSPAHQCLPNVSLKRKYGSTTSPLGTGDVYYPSPPMSGPPSPPPTAPEVSHRASISPTFRYTTTGASVTTSTASVSNVPAPGSTSSATGASYSTATVPRYQPHATLSAPRTFAEPLSPYEPPRNAPPAFSVYPAFSPQPSGRTARKVKAHVASACVNCKRAHLSCDVQRPCGRCAASGKQDTCYDVQHKKRGRPRLRDEGSFEVERVMPVQRSPPAVQETAVVASGSRPIAHPRQRRTGSMRSSSSQTTEGSTVQPPSISAYSSILSPPSYQQASSSNLAPADIPTVFLDVDLVALRANRAFEEVMSGGREVNGRSIGSIALPADGQSFESIRARLQTERNRREQSSLPPISPRGGDALQGVSEEDVDRLASSFEDRMYTWTRNSAGQSSETFPARVRLAKSSTYFVVVTLPSFHPAISSPSVAAKLPAPYYTSPRPPFAPTQHAQPQPPSTLPPISPASRSRPETPSSRPAQYQSPQWSTSPYQRAPLPPTSRLPALEPSSRATRYPGSVPAAGGMRPPSDPGAVHLPPIVSGAAMPGGPSRSSGEERARRASEAEEGGERSPKKRKVMGIDNVLQ